MEARYAALFAGFITTEIVAAVIADLDRMLALAALDGEDYLRALTMRR
jgi:hypothetical protein